MQTESNLWESFVNVLQMKHWNIYSDWILGESIWESNASLKPSSNDYTCMEHPYFGSDTAAGVVQSFPEATLLLSWQCAWAEIKAFVPAWDTEYSVKCSHSGLFWNALHPSLSRSWLPVQNDAAITVFDYERWSAALILSFCKAPPSIHLLHPLNPRVVGGPEPIPAVIGTRCSPSHRDKRPRTHTHSSGQFRVTR